MKIVLALAIAWMLIPIATQAELARTNRVTIAYVSPKNVDHRRIYDQLKESRSLEKLQNFLSPFRLPRPLKFKLEGCDGDANAFYEDYTITVCYEYIDELWKNMPAETTAAGVAPIDAVVGPLFDTCLHEFGHALFDMLKVPLFGREEDAADQLSAFIILHMGKAEARRLISGTAYAFRTEAVAATAPPTLKQFSDVHGTPAQRFYNSLCIAYGADAKLFGDLVAKGYLPKERAEDCETEYEQVAYAFQELIGPHVDESLAKNVLDKSWLPPASTRVQRRPGSASRPQ